MYCECYANAQSFNGRCVPPTQMEITTELTTSTIATTVYSAPRYEKTTLFPSGMNFLGHFVLTCTWSTQTENKNRNFYDFLEFPRIFRTS